MKTMMQELRDVPAKKKVTTTVEYSCKEGKDVDKVFDAVRDIVTDHLDEFAKITFDRNDSNNSCKVELITNK